MRILRIRWMLRPGLTALAVTLLLAVPAWAGPVTVWADGVSGFGWEAATITGTGGAQENGATDLGGLPDGAMFLSDPMGTKFSFVTPDPIPFAQPAVPSRANPVTSSVTTWTITANDAYEDLYIVFAGHDPTDVNPYATANVGLHIDPMSAPWTTIEPDPTGFPDVWYLAYFVGDEVAAGQSVDIAIEYRVAQTLFPGPLPGQLQFPKLRIGFIGNAVPEPGAAAMMAIAGLALAAGRRGR